MKIHGKALTLVMICALGLAAVMGGCSSDGDNQQNERPYVAGGPAESMGNKAETIDLETLKTDKWNTYVDFSNNFNRQVPDAVAAYPRAFGSEPAFRRPTEENDRIDFTNKMLNDQNLKKSIDAVIAISVEEPVDNLDQAAVVMASALKPAWSELRSMADYFRNKEYIDDDYLKAQQLHSSILMHLAAFEPTMEPFFNLLSSRETEVRVSEMTRMKAEGSIIGPAALDYLIEAEALTAYWTTNEITSESFNSKLDMTVYRPLYNKLGDKLKALEKAVEEEAIAKEGLSASGVNYYLERAKKFKTQAAAAIELYGKKQKNILPMNPGAPESITREYDDLVRSYNSLMR